MNRKALAVSYFLFVAFAWACGTSAIGPGGTGGGGPGGDATAPTDAEAEGEDATSDAKVATDSGRDSGKDAGRDSIADTAPDALDALDGSTDVFVQPPTPAVRYVGRVDDTDINGPRVAWAAARAIVRFDGTALEATLAHTNGLNGGPTYVDVVIDGSMQPTPILVPTGISTFAVASGLAAGTHVVELVKRTEAQHGVLQFRGFAYPNGGQLLAPLPAPLRRIEVLGNSVMSAYGVEGAGPVCVGGVPSVTCNSDKSAAQIAATTLGADLFLTAYAGKGITLNVTPGDNLTLPILFDRNLPDTANSAWNFANYVPHVFVLGIANVDIDTPEPTLTDSYEAFAIKVRGVYPAAHIMYVVNAGATDDYPVGQMMRTKLKAMAATVISRRKAAGDLNVSNYTMTEYTNGQLSGCDYHPNVALQAQMGAELISFLQAELGW